ncbi:MAG: flagellar biosynthesis protein FlhF [Gammaproteobacteria bacterium SHHR-1]|uniref:flagellar biosynthesis protein FlhF n=1 Tax=Magnetovirga frankeli TaxID=947516 RepID=UPI00129362B4|nr:flagellar biosynthesis protein FlhF [gamma proteobacterium SS-5]
MNIKRFQAADMRQALQQVREELGPDAVILSNRKGPEGIEIVAAVDFDESAFDPAEGPDEADNAPQARFASDFPTDQAQAPARPQVSAQHQAQQQHQAQAQGANARSAIPRPASDGYRRPAAQAARLASVNSPRPAPSRPAKAQAQSRLQAQAQPTYQRPVSRPSAGSSAPVSQINVKQPLSAGPSGGLDGQTDDLANNPILLEMRREMENMRRMMRNEFSLLGWDEMGRKQPEAQELFRRLMSLDLSADLCHGLARKVEGVEELEKSWRKALAILAASLPVFQGNLIDEGGVVALVGPTGVGKTTTIAKLAARFCLRHGNRHLGLISADGYRLGGQDQLIQYARLLDVPVRSAATVKDLEIAVNAFADKRLILVDTTGMGQRDARLQEQLSLLGSERRPVRSFLTLSSSTQQAALEQAILAFKAVRPEACVITKVDEAASLGGVFSALIRQGLPLAFITDGQKVPEDLHLPRTQALVNRAVNMSQQYAIGQSDQFVALSLAGGQADARV